MSRPGSSRNDYNAYTPYRGHGGYQVSSGALYVPDTSRDDTTSPMSSVRSSSPQRGPAAPNNIDPYNSYESYRQQARQGIHEQQQQPQAYPQSQQSQHVYQQASSQESQSRRNPAASGKSLPRRPLPGVPQAEVALDGKLTNIPVPPSHTRTLPQQEHQTQNVAQGYPPPNPYQTLEQPYPSRQRNDSYTSTSAGQNPFNDAQSSQLSLAAAAATPSGPTNLNRYQDNVSQLHLAPTTLYQGNPSHSGSAENGYRHSMGNNGQNLGSINPADIDDDEDDQVPTGARRAGAAAGAGLAAASTAQAGGAGGFLKGLAPRDASGAYGQVPGGSQGAGEEKRSDWLKQQTTGNKRLKWMVAALIVVVIVLAIIGGVVGAVLSNKSSSSSSNADGVPSAGRLNQNSPSIKGLMNNPKLHKVFPGMDYSPLNTQYPECLSNPPIQNNITADIAVLSQLTPVIRLYGTDCKQTEMVLTAIKDLGLTKSMKVWGGIYLNGNSTTNNRQMQQMYEVLDKYGPEQFEGIIVGNEVLFSTYLTLTQLIGKMNQVRSHLRQKGMSSLKVATGDLGSAWTSELAAASDVLMANVHPFFGGVAAPQAAKWTYQYFENNDVSLIDGMAGKSAIIAETGWPSEGGNYCTESSGGHIPCTSSTAGAVAGISEANTFIEGFVCSSLDKGLDYFWFEAFDEPWKASLNTKNEHWEPKWGLFDVDRNLKEGLRIPDCGGKTAELRR